MTPRASDARNSLTSYDDPEEKEPRRPRMSTSLIERSPRPEFTAYPRTTPVVFIVDSDVSVRESLQTRIRSAGWQSEAFASASEFLARPRVLTPSCLVLDISLPDLNGLDLQKRVAVDRKNMPVIFV